MRSFFYKKFKKTLDKLPGLCYNKGTKEKELTLMKNIKWKHLDEMSGLDLTAISYAVSLLIGWFCEISLPLMFTITAGLATYITFRSKRVSLTILNASVFLYSISGVWLSIWTTVVEWWDNITAPLTWLW